MAASTIRIRPSSHKALKEIAAQTGRSLQDTLDEAIEDRRRKLYLEGAITDYAALSKNSVEQSEFNNELTAWDATNSDGLDEQ